MWVSLKRRNRGELPARDDQAILNDSVLRVARPERPDERAEARPGEDVPRPEPRPPRDDRN